MLSVSFLCAFLGELSRAVIACFDRIKMVDFNCLRPLLGSKILKIEVMTVRQCLCVYFFMCVWFNLLFCTFCFLRFISKECVSPCTVCMPCPIQKKIYVIKITPLFDVLCLFTFSLCFCYYKFFVCQLLNLGFRLFLECSFVSLFRSRA